MLPKKKIKNRAIRAFLIKNLLVFPPYGPNADFRAKYAVFLARNPFFLEIVQIFCYHQDWTPKRQHFCVDLVARWASGAHFWPKKVEIRPGSRQTAHRAAKRPPTGKPKLSRVTSGHGGLMIPLSRVRLTQKMGVI